MADREIFYKKAGGPTFGEFVSISRFVVIEGTNNRLLLRCFNSGDRIVTGLVIAVYLIGDDGTETKRREFTLSGLFGEPGTEFSVQDIPLPSSWQKVRAEILSAQTFDREYDFRDGSASYTGAPSCRRVHKRDKTTFPLAKYGVILSALMFLLASVSVLACLLS